MGARTQHQIHVEESGSEQHHQNCNVSEVCSPHSCSSHATHGETWSPDAKPCRSQVGSKEPSELTTRERPHNSLGELPKGHIYKSTAQKCLVCVEGPSSADGGGSSGGVNCLAAAGIPWVSTHRANFSLLVLPSGLAQGSLHGVMPSVPPCVRHIWLLGQPARE